MSATKLAWRVDASNPALTITSAADLTAGATLLSGPFNNTPGAITTGDYVWADCELYLPNGIGAALTVEQPVELYIIPSLDGTHYADFDTDFTDVLAPQNLYKGAFMVRAESTASTPQRLHLLDVMVPPSLFKVGIRNNTGQSLKDGTNHFTLKMFLKAFQNI